MLVTCTQRRVAFTQTHHRHKDTRSHTTHTDMYTHQPSHSCMVRLYRQSNGYRQRLRIDIAEVEMLIHSSVQCVRAYFYHNRERTKNQIGVRVYWCIRTVFYRYCVCFLFDFSFFSLRSSVYVCINDICLFDSFKSFHPKKLSISCWVFELKPNTMNRLRVYRSISLDCLNFFLQ